MEFIENSSLNRRLHFEGCWLCCVSLLVSIPWHKLNWDKVCTLQCSLDIFDYVYPLECCCMHKIEMQSEMNWFDVGLKNCISKRNFTMIELRKLIYFPFNVQFHFIDFNFCSVNTKKKIEISLYIPSWCQINWSNIPNDPYYVLTIFFLSPTKCVMNWRILWMSCAIYSIITCDIFRVQSNESRKKMGKSKIKHKTSSLKRVQ